MNKHQRIAEHIGKEEAYLSVSSPRAQPVLETARGSTSVRPGSTGPRTPAGKRRSRSNALKHGIFAGALLLEEESRGEYELVLNGLGESLKPEGTLEDLLVEMLVTSVWRLRRLMKAEAKEATQPDAAPPDREDMELRLRYEAGILRSFERTLNLLEHHQRMRSGQSPSPTVRLELPG